MLISLQSSHPHPETVLYLGSLGFKLTWKINQGGHEECQQLWDTSQKGLKREGQTVKLSTKVLSEMSSTATSVKFWGRRFSEWEMVIHLILWVQCCNFQVCKMLTTSVFMAPHSSTLAWKIPWTEEPGRLQTMGSRRVGHDWATSLSLFPFMHWRRKWQPTPVFLPGESQGRGSLVGRRLWGRTESDTTEVT